MASKQPAHPPLEDQELFIAAIGGVGLALIIGAAVFSGFGTVEDTSTLTVAAIVGFGALVLAAVLWWGAMRPWESFDDLKTPYYTGHDHHHEHPQLHVEDHAPCPRPRPAR
ncbi:MAG: hypothetical protein HC915_03995 [Anaerolineae bacterium]|nr:hypothetical protein [Anaerolineae bacterium]